MDALLESFEGSLSRVIKAEGGEGRGVEGFEGVGDGKGVHQVRRGRSGEVNGGDGVGDAVFGEAGGGVVGSYAAGRRECTNAWWQRMCEGATRLGLRVGKWRRHLQGRQSGFNVGIFHPLGLVFQAFVIQCETSCTRASVLQASMTILHPHQGGGNTFPRIQRPAADVVTFAGQVIQNDSGIVGHVDIACYFIYFR